MRVQRVSFPPARLAAYMAVSWTLTRSSISSRSAGQARPSGGAHDADAGRDWVADGGDGFAQLFGDVVRSSVRQMSAMTNSSPPKRAIIVVVGQTRRRTPAIATRALSPVDGHGCR